VRHFTKATSAAVIGLAAGLSACGGGSSTSSSTTTSTTSAASTSTTSSSTTATTGGGGASATSINIQNFAFQPASTTVKAGARITVKNSDSVAHTVTADNNAFNTGDISASGTKTFTAPSNPGTFPYHCSIHPFMHGTLTVTS
jgi:plastocyanin